MSEFDILFENETFGFSLSESTIRVSTVAIVQDISSPHLIMNHPELQVGAILVRVGDIKVRGLTLKQITPILKRASRPIVLRFDDSRRWSTKFKLIFSPKIEKLVTENIYFQVDQINEWVRQTNVVEIVFKSWYTRRWKLAYTYSNFKHQRFSRGS